MKAFNVLSPLKRLKQLCIVVAVEFIFQLFLELKYQSSWGEIYIKFSLKKKKKKTKVTCIAVPFFCRKNNLNCELNSGAPAAIYV